jgi:glycerol uptake facilitator-like aquaporin
MRAFVSEFLGTLFLVATVVGSGIMAENLSMGNQALALWLMPLPQVLFYMF